MSLILIIAGATALGLALVVLGVGMAASRARTRSNSRRSELLGLAKVRSPSGKSFFPTEESALELAELLDDVDERSQPDTDR